MRIGDAAAAAGLTPRAVRYYEQRGLLTARRTPSGHRAYGPDDVRRLRAVRELLDIGLTIADVRAFVHVLGTVSTRGAGSGPPGAGEGEGRCEVAEVTLRRLADLDERIALLTELRARLADSLVDQFGDLIRELDSGPRRPSAS